MNIARSHARCRVSRSVLSYRPLPLPLSLSLGVFGFLSQLGAVDATENAQLAGKYNVKGYPTIKTFPAGPKKRPEDYNGPREAAGIVDFATGVG